MYIVLCIGFVCTTHNVHAIYKNYNGLGLHQICVHIILILILIIDPFVPEIYKVALPTCTNMNHDQCESDVNLTILDLHVNLCLYQVSAFDQIL